MGPCGADLVEEEPQHLVRVDPSYRCSRWAQGRRIPKSREEACAEWAERAIKSGAGT
jgi:hypothetical protein